MWHVTFVALFSAMAGICNRDDLCMFPCGSSPGILVSLTAVLLQAIVIATAVQVNSATPPSGTGEGFSSVTLLLNAITIREREREKERERERRKRECCNGKDYC